jgi:hypothetical protein
VNKDQTNPRRQKGKSNNNSLNKASKTIKKQAKFIKELRNQHDQQNKEIVKLRNKIEKQARQSVIINLIRKSSNKVQTTRRPKKKSNNNESISNVHRYDPKFFDMQSIPIARVSP